MDTNVTSSHELWLFLSFPAFQEETEDVVDIHQQP
jgi:hypothetical protein